ncbi:MAG: TetR/AcrR family transcriptional regulator [Mycobacterium sp.]
MPPNRRSIPRAERLEAVVAAARRRFEANGYKATSIADIAGDLGVNTGSIHWYFPSKDALFAAVVSRIVEESKDSVDAALEAGVAPMDALVGFLTSAERYRGIHVDAHERITDSDAVAEVHESLHDWLDELLLTVVRPRLGPGQDVTLIADTAHIVFEGLLGSTIPRDRPFEEIVKFLVDMLASAAPHAERRVSVKGKRPTN